MAADWTWCSVPPKMEDGQEEREFIRWRKWYAGKVRDMLVNPLTEVSLAVQEMERADVKDPELLENIALAREGQDTLAKALNRLSEVAGMEEDWT